MSSVERLSKIEKEKAEEYILKNYDGLFNLDEIRAEMDESENKMGPDLVLHFWINKAESIAERRGIVNNNVDGYELRTVLKAIKTYEKDRELKPELTTTKYVAILAIGEATTIKTAMRSDRLWIAVSHTDKLKNLLDFYQTLR